MEERELGRGAYGSVYQMRHSKTDTIMAVKVCVCVCVCDEGEEEDVGKGEEESLCRLVFYRELEPPLIPMSGGGS